MGDGGDEPDKPKTSVFASAVLQFCFSSVGMMVGNKMAMDFLRKSERGVGLPSTLVVIQVVGTLFLLFFAREHIDKEKVTKRNIQSWLPVFTLFAGMLYTSAKTFQYVNVSFVIIVRNVGAIFTTCMCLPDVLQPPPMSSQLLNTLSVGRMSMRRLWLLSW